MTDDPRPMSRELLDAIKAFGDHPAVGYLLDAIRKELREAVAALSPEPPPAPPTPRDAGDLTPMALVAELAEARRTLQWQPIETAPKDGRDVLLTNGEYKRTGYWAKAINAWSIDAAVRLDQPTHYLIIPPAPPED